MDETLDSIAWAMNLLDMVDWDRCTVSLERGTVFGWIERDDGRNDFVVLFWDATGFGYTTSSAKHSREIGERLGFPEGGHRDCERVEDVFGNRVNRVIHQKTT